MIASTRGDEGRELIESIVGLAEAADLDEDSERLALKPTQPRCPSPHLPSSTFTFSQPRSFAPPFCSSPYPFQSPKTFWLDPLALNEPALPPRDIIPYLGHGSTRFAGLMLWSIMKHSQTHCSHPHPPPLEVIRRGLQHCSTTRELNPPFVLDMVEARVQYIRDGGLAARLTVAGEVDLGMVVHGRIMREYRERGEEVDGRWLTCVALEEGVRDMVGPRVFDILERGAAGDGGEFVNGLMEGFKCRLYESCVCFGDGPRWHVDVVQGLVRNLMEKALQGRG